MRHKIKNNTIFYSKHHYLRIAFICSMVILFMVAGSVTAKSALNTNTTILYETDNMNRYSKVDGQTITYDGQGNVLNDGTNTYTYNLLNQQTSVSQNGQTTQYLYDALGRRIGKIQNGVTTRYVYDVSYQVLEENEIGVTKARYTYGKQLDTPVRLETNSNKYYYHQDALGNVSEMTGETGSVVEKYEYNVYGELQILDGNNNPITASSINNPYTFTGRRYDPESGNYYYRARVYKASWGQFLQRDSIDPGLRGGTPQGHNRYSYTMNNPTNFTDPSGHISVPRVLRCNRLYQWGCNQQERQDVQQRQIERNYPETSICGDNGVSEYSTTGGSSSTSVNWGGSGGVNATETSGQGGSSVGYESSTTDPSVTVKCNPPQDDNDKKDDKKDDKPEPKEPEPKNDGDKEDREREPVTGCRRQYNETTGVTVYPIGDPSSCSEEHPREPLFGPTPDSFKKLDDGTLICMSGGKIVDCQSFGPFDDGTELAGAPKNPMPKDLSCKPGGGKDLFFGGPNFWQG